jgi:hypothetical protein
LTHDVNLSTKRVKQMAIWTNIGGSCIPGGGEAAARDVFGTTGLSGVSDFATNPDARPLRRMTLKALAAAFKADEFGVRRASRAARNCEFSRGEWLRGIR